ncbi:MAG TPA: hypothetical protein VGN97_14340 [Mesorhizobium sp.]|nr:hypothetical protein [Mesorhizobium sp.]
MAAILPLAVAIADVIRQAARERAPVEVEERADELLHGHPEADATHEEVVEALIVESSSMLVPVALGRAA